VTKLMTGRSWSEDPVSRTRRLITNIRVLDDDGVEMTVASNFMLYRTRLDSQEDTWIGSREDRLRRVGSSMQIAARVIRLEQTVVLSRNLSNFF
jgi:biphenyl 2,3-dioxygenase beta subunit